MNINFITGSALEPDVIGQKFIVHVCNDIGGWGSGFVVPLGKKWPRSEASYRRWHKESKNPDSKIYNSFNLGMVQPVPVEDDIIVMNMIAQHGHNPADKPIRYEALKQCLTKVAEYAELHLNASIHMPRIGCGLAGGEWSKVQEIIEETLKDLPVYVYTLEGDTSWR